MLARELHERGGGYGGERGSKVGGERGIGIERGRDRGRSREREPGRSCALVDADFSGGGMDVLLGLESEPGMRFDEIDASLGHVDGDALNHELLQWDGVGVLAYDSWSGPAPNRWQVSAAVHALVESNGSVVVDAGRGESLDMLPQASASRLVLVVELSVLGVARAKSWLAGRWNRGRDAEERFGEFALVGVRPRGMPRGASAISLGQAEDYLDRPFVTWIQHDARMYADVLHGFGIRRPMKANRTALETLADWVLSASADAALADRADCVDRVGRAARTDRLGRGGDDRR